MFIGINGYTKAGDKYDALLPAVDSWTLDRRKKASKRNNFAGGFTASVNKNDEYRFYSVSWESLPENDFSTSSNTTDIYEAVSRITSQLVQISTSETNVNIQPIAMDLKPDTAMWLKYEDGTFVSVKVTRAYTANQNTIFLSANKLIQARSTTLLVLHKGRGLGLLSLASLAATGSTHILRDFMGNLVKVIFQSPKYNALAGTDDYKQMYYDVKLDFDIVADTASQSYVATKGLSGNTSNESLPRISTVSNASGSYDLSTFFVREGNSFNTIQLDKIISGTKYQLFTTAKISPILPESTKGMPMLSLSRKIGVFKNYISTKNQLNLKFTGAGGLVIRDDAGADNELEISLDVPEMIYVGAYNANIEYGAWDDYKPENTYTAGTFVKSNGFLYVCIAYSAPPGSNLSDNKIWYGVPLSTALVTLVEGKTYKLIKPTSKGEDPKSTPAAWLPYTVTLGDMFFKSTSKLNSTLRNGDSLIFVIQPFAFQNLDKKGNKSSVLLRVPVINGPVVQDLDINNQASITKLSSMYPVGDKIAANMIGTGYDIITDSNTRYYQNSQLGSSVQAHVGESSPAFNYNTGFYQSRFNIEQCNNKIINYTVAAIVEKGNSTIKIANGMSTLQITGGNPSNVEFVFGKGQVPTKATLALSNGTLSKKTTLVQSFNTITLDKKLYETILDPKTNNVTVNVYWLTLDDTYPNGIKVVKDEPTQCGLSLIKNKQTFTGTATLSSTNELGDFTLSQSGGTANMAFSSSVTYDMQPIGDSFIAKFFYLEDNTWI